MPLSCRRIPASSGPSLALGERRLGSPCRPWVPTLIAPLFPARQKQCCERVPAPSGAPGVSGADSLAHEAPEQCGVQGHA